MAHLPKVEQELWTRQERGGMHSARGEGALGVWGPVTDLADPLQAMKCCKCCLPEVADVHSLHFAFALVFLYRLRPKGCASILSIQKTHFK